MLVWLVFFSLFELSWMVLVDDKFRVFFLLTTRSINICTGIRYFSTRISSKTMHMWVWAVNVWVSVCVAKYISPYSAQRICTFQRALYYLPAVPLANSFHFVHSFGRLTHLNTCNLQWIYWFRYKAFMAARVKSFCRQCLAVWSHVTKLTCELFYTLCVCLCVCASW